jgi:hypothetical protein
VKRPVPTLIHDGKAWVEAVHYDELRAENERLREALKSVAVLHCREWCDDKVNYCNEPAEFLIWGKLIPPNGLGPRCYDHAAEHVGHRALGNPSWAIVDLRPALRALSSVPELVAMREDES